MGAPPPGSREAWEAVEGAGAEPELIAPEKGEVQAFEHLDKADTFDATTAVADADPDDYDALVLPGGVANPDNLRTIPEAVEFVRSFFEAGKPAGLVTSRKPDDLDAFCAKAIEEIAEGVHADQREATVGS